MTAELEYSYLGTEFVLRASEEIMSRAVRVKVAVKDKIKRIFDNNVSVLSKVEPVVEPTVTTNEAVQVETGVGALLDISEENLLALNEKLNKMQEQEKVPYVVKRAVLFTSGLVGKIEGVTGKWFEGMPVFEKKIDVQPELPSVEISNHLGGEVVPGTWDDVPEKSEEPTAVENPTVNIEMPTTDITVESVADAVQEEPVVPEIEIPSFMPNDELTQSVETEMEVQNETEFVPEPLPVVETTEEYVPEPTEISETEVQNEVASELPSVEVEIPVADAVQEEPVVPNMEIQNEEISKPEIETEPEMESEEASVDVESEEPVEEKGEDKDKMSIEDKIAELLNRKREMHQEDGEIEVTKVEEAEVDEEADKQMVSDKPELTQAGVMARLQRINNTMKEKDATIRTLTAKNETAKEEVAQAKEKISGYEAVVNDLTMKNNSLSKENERLTAKVEEAETASQNTISRLETQVSELTEAKAQEVESSKRMIADLKAKHEEEMARLREKHAKELAAINETKERQIQAIYQTISEALGEPVEEYDSSPKMVA